MVIVLKRDTLMNKFEMIRDYAESIIGECEAYEEFTGMITEYANSLGIDSANDKIRQNNLMSVWNEYWSNYS
jgi:hypothetical protein